MPQPFSIQQRVYVEDTDFGGVMYHTNFIKFMERARTEWLNHIGHDLKSIAESGIIFAIVHVDVTYHKPATVNDLLTITADISKVGKSSVVFSQRIHKPDDPNHVYCDGMVTVVCLNKTSMRPTRIPTFITEAAQ